MKETRGNAKWSCTEQTDIFYYTLAEKWEFIMLISMYSKNVVWNLAIFLSKSIQFRNLKQS